ncbi:uncharacterized protein LOC132660101 [Ovis aries]|uniref:uncharacterized protein LOC132660101 n=1 Tax=Ovis aries TaxID=9940 RepID=UPI00100EFD02|nr:uncharacterized protein LOC132660101 [Ovis aries]
MVEKEQNEVHKETARGLYQNPESKPIFYVKDDPSTAEGRPAPGAPGVRASSAGRGSSAVPRGPGLVPSSLLHPARPGEPPSDPAAPPPRQSPVSPRARAHTHPSPLKRAVGWESGVAEPLRAPRRHVVLCGKRRASPLKTQRSVLAGKGAWARTCC